MDANADGDLGPIDLPGRHPGRRHPADQRANRQHLEAGRHLVGLDPVAANGRVIGSSRYLQYRVELSTSYPPPPRCSGTSASPTAGRRCARRPRPRTDGGRRVHHLARHTQGRADAAGGRAGRPARSSRPGPDRRDRAGAGHRQPAHRHLVGVGCRRATAVHHPGGRARPAGFRLYRRPVPGRQRGGPDRRWPLGRPFGPAEVGGASPGTRCPPSPGSGCSSASGFWAITSVVAVDRLGKGLRTGPRDSLIATASEPEHLARNFGVHRAMDTTGALIGPLLAFAILAMFPIGLLGFQTIFVFSCAFAVMGVAVLAIAVPDLRRKSQRRATASGGRRCGPGPARLVRPCPPGTAPPADGRGSAVVGDHRRRVHLSGRCRTAGSCRRPTSRCCSSGPTSRTCCLPSRWANWQTGSAGRGCSWPAMSCCLGAICSPWLQVGWAGRAGRWCCCCWARSTPPPTECWPRWPAAWYPSRAGQAASAPRKLLWRSPGSALRSDSACCGSSPASPPR